MPHSYTQLLYHIVFSTKGRQPWLGDSVGSQVHAYLGGGIRDEGPLGLDCSEVSSPRHRGLGRGYISPAHPGLSHLFS